MTESTIFLFLIFGFIPTGCFTFGYLLAKYVHFDAIEEHAEELRWHKNLLD